MIRDLDHNRTADCFGNTTPGMPPSISDTFADIQRYAHISFARRYEYHNARVHALIGRESPKRAWRLLREMQTETGDHDAV